jgi:hypothetical protein
VDITLDLASVGELSLLTRTTPVMAIYRLVRPLSAFAEDEKFTFNIPTGSLVRKDNYVPAAGLTTIGWGFMSVTVGVQDFLRFVEPFAEIEQRGD